jgi:acyl carrier protein
LKEFLAKDLPAYMIPSYFVRMEKMPLTPNGKIDRKALPAPLVTRGEGHGCTAPGDSIEKQLAELWSGVLGIEVNKLSIDANFFQLGGHSLKATILVSKIHKKVDVKLPLVEVFKTPTIRGQALYIKKAAKDKYASLEAVEKREYYELSSAQKRLYFLQQLDPQSTAYNMPGIIPLSQKHDVVKLEEAFKKLINRHESFRTSFHMKDNQPIQRIHDTVDFEIEYDDTEGLPQSTVEEKVLIDFARPFDHSKAPLLRVGLVEVKDAIHLLLVDMHHIITDATSKDILEKEFMDLYSGKELFPLRLQYKDFSEWQNSEKQKELLKQQELYWLNIFSDELPVLDLAPGTEFCRKPREFYLECQRNENFKIYYKRK